MKTTMYDNLLLLPLFQGLSKNDMTTIIEKVKLHFLTYQKGETILQQGEPCNQLCFLLNGEVMVQTKDAHNDFSLSEILKEPYIIEPQSVFGTIDEKFMNFIAHRSQLQEGEKRLTITMEDLSNLINETRINLSRLLNDLQSKGLVQLKRKEIFIPRFEQLVAHLTESFPNDIEP